jgi:hypothetical protein
MRGRDFRGVAQNLAVMAVSSRLAEDLETLSALPDGAVSVNLVTGTAKTATGVAVSLRIGQMLWSWLDQQSSERGFGLSEIERAEILIYVDTSRIPTNRASIISFDLRAVARLVRGGREYAAESANHLWHDRTPNKSMHATREDTRA